MSGREIGSRIVRVLGSFGLACILLVLLLVITFVGTLEQANSSLFEVQKRYFESLIVPNAVGMLPLPGAYLLLSLLFVNLVVGGMIRMRRTASRIGIYIIHIGIATLLAGGFVEMYFSDKGLMTLYEGESGDSFKSSYEWEVSIAEQFENGRERAFLIPQEHFQDAGPGTRAYFHSDQLPFRVTLSGYLRNSRPRTASADGGIDGFVLEKFALDIEEERNIPGVMITLEQPDGKLHRALLWGLQRHPVEVQVDGRRWALDLHQREYPLPYGVTLKKFTRSLHPGTGMAASFSSDITRLQDGVATDVHISMNDPMREGGYTFYQSGWGPQDAGPNSRLFSTFSVVKNPSDQVPLYATIIIAIGLLVHFIRKLVLYILAVGRRSS